MSRAFDVATDDIKRRTNVVGILPDDAAVARLVTAVIVETHDERASLPLRRIHGQAPRHHRSRAPQRGLAFVEQGDRFHESRHSIGGAAGADLHERHNVGTGGEHQRRGRT